MQSPEQIARAALKAAGIKGVRAFQVSIIADVVADALDDCAARERERCATLIRNSEPELWAAGSDQAFIAGYKAALSGIFAAIRALS